MPLVYLKYARGFFQKYTWYVMSLVLKKAHLPSSTNTSGTDPNACQMAGSFTVGSTCKTACCGVSVQGMVGYRDHSLPHEIFEFGNDQHVNRFRRFLGRIRAMYNSDNPEDVTGGLQVSRGMLTYVQLLHAAYLMSPGNGIRFPLICLSNHLLVRHGQR